MNLCNVFLLFTLSLRRRYYVQGNLDATRLHLMKTANTRNTKKERERHAQILRRSTFNTRSLQFFSKISYIARILLWLKFEKTKRKEFNFVDGHPNIKTKRWNDRSRKSLNKENCRSNAQPYLLVWPLKVFYGTDILTLTHAVTHASRINSSFGGHWPHINWQSPIWFGIFSFIKYIYLF